MPPIPLFGVLLAKRSDAADDEDDMSDASDEHHQRVGPMYVPGTQQGPQFVTLKRFSVLRSWNYEVSEAGISAACATSIAIGA